MRHGHPEHDTDTTTHVIILKIITSVGVGVGARHTIYQRRQVLHR